MCIVYYFRLFSILSSRALSNDLVLLFIFSCSFPHHFTNVLPGLLQLVPSHRPQPRRYRCDVRPLGHDTIAAGGAGDTAEFRISLEASTSIFVTMSGMGGSVGAAHSFVWVRRHDYLVSTFGESAIAFDEPAHPGDVIMIPRKYMASTKVWQQPNVAMPYSRLNLLRAQSHPYPKIAPPV